MPHEECVSLIKRAGDTLALKVVTANPSTMMHSHYQHQDSSTNQNDLSSQSLPYRRKGKELDFVKDKFEEKIWFYSPTSTRSRTTI